MAGMVGDDGKRNSWRKIMFELDLEWLHLEIPI